MPTKPNRAGEQQNYVPAGNGDASGEYGDNATGSNVHFTNFKKPEKTDDNISVVSKTNSPNKSVGKSFKEYIDKNHKSDFGKTLTSNYDVGTDDAKDLVDKMIAYNGVIIDKTENISHYNGAINLNTNSIGNFGKYSAKVEGETFYHEFWHCFDERFAHNTVNDNGEIIHNSLITDEDKEHLRNTSNSWIEATMFTWNLSTGKVLSNGKTLYETLKQEANSMSRKGVWQQLQIDYKKEIDDLVNEKYPNSKDIYTKLGELNDKFIKQANEKYPLSGNLSMWQNNKDYLDKLETNSKEFQDLEKLRSEIVRYRSDMESQAARSWMSISDMYGIHKKIPYGFCGGHKGSYGKNKGAMAHEFVAEMGSAMSRNDEYAKKEIAIMEKYMPESSKMFKELREMILNSAKEYK